MSMTDGSRAGMISTGRGVPFVPKKRLRLNRVDVRLDPFSGDFRRSPQSPSNPCPSIIWRGLRGVGAGCVRRFAKIALGHIFRSSYWLMGSHTSIALLVDSNIYPVRNMGRSIQGTSPLVSDDKSKPTTLVPGSAPELDTILHDYSPSRHLSPIPLMFHTTFNRIWPSPT